MNTARDTMIHTVREAYMEVFPTDSIESRLRILDPGSYVAVTCSPAKGVDVTLDLCERLAKRGFKVVPHLAAKMVKSKAHLRELLARITDLPIVSIFVPGGDAAKALGEYSTAYQLLCDIADFDHNLTEIGVAAHPEGHPSVPDDVLRTELRKKQQVANYLVTQMCFEANVIESWLRSIRQDGISMPAWLGLPTVSDRGALLRTSMRIGVGNSLRYLKNHGNIITRLLRSRDYKPNSLLLDLEPIVANQEFGIAGYHMYCFNQVQKAEQWRADFLAELER